MRACKTALSPQTNSTNTFLHLLIFLLLPRAQDVTFLLTSSFHSSSSADLHWLQRQWALPPLSDGGRAQALVAIVLRFRYAILGTDLAYAATRFEHMEHKVGPISADALARRCAVLTHVRCYQMAHTMIPLNEESTGKQRTHVYYRYNFHVLELHPDVDAIIEAVQRHLSYCKISGVLTVWGHQVIWDNARPEDPWTDEGLRWTAQDMHQVDILPVENALEDLVRRPPHSPRLYCAMLQASTAVH
eukprot:1978512-Rhodomonas_salina.1